MAQSENRLAPGNCNKACCKSCMFGPTPINLSPERNKEIRQYLEAGTSSHICHVTNLTCYGGMQVTAKEFYRKGIIPEPTVESFLETARAILGL